MGHIKIMKIIGYIFGPLLIWGLPLTFVVGFYFPLIYLKKHGEDVNWFSDVFLLGLKRAKSYKWEILFASLSGIVFINTYIFLQGFIHGQLKSSLLSLIGIFGLVSLLFGKGYKIASGPPRSLKKSVSFLWRGFLSPFNKNNLLKLKNFIEKEIE